MTEIRVKLFDRLKIRDTNAKYPAMLLDLRDAEYWGFEVDNSHDQNATVSLIGGSVGVPGSAGNVGADVTVNSATVEPIATDIWLPFLGLKVAFATAPTSGEITITGFVKRKR